MKQYSYWRAIVMSFYSKELYQDVNKNWGSDAIFYLLLVVALSWLPGIFQMQLALKNEAPQVLEAYVEQFPEISIKNGVATTPENRPYYIKSHESNQVIAIIDTSGQYKSLDKANVDILMTQNEIISRDHEDSIKIQTIPAKLTMQVKPQEVKETLLKWLPWLWLLVLPAVVIFSFVFRVIQAAFYGVFGKIFSLLMDVSLPYTSIVRLAMVAVTPAIVLSTILDGLTTLQGMGYVYFGVSLAYLFFAIQANR